MNKIMTSMIAIFAGFAAYANTVDIDADGNRLNSNPAVAANCTEPILGTYSGSTDFEAKWQANSIPLRWYSDDEQLQVQGEAGTCTYDSGLTVPSSQYQPTKRGYHFRGWTIKTASDNCEITGEMLDALPDDARGPYGAIDNGDGFATINADTYGLTENNTWAAEFTDGTIIKGMSKCIDSSSNMNSTNSGRYCWCRATNYISNGGNTCDVSSTSAWAFSNIDDNGYDHGGEDECNDMCVMDCVLKVREGAFRRAMFGITQ